MPSRFSLRHLLTAGGLTLLSVGCSDKSPVEPSPLPSSPAELPLVELVVSDPFASGASSAAAQTGFAGASVASDEGEVTYVSLPPGSVPRAISITIRNVTSGASPTPPSPFLNGGFDPIRVVAREGDELEIAITRAGVAPTVNRMRVPRRSPPRVVRTSPPRGMNDVPLNSRVVVVLTEPIASSTLTTGTVQLLQGTTLVRGTVRLVEGSLFEAEFVPDQDLAAGTTYRLVVTRGVLDADGDSLETALTTEFTTVTALPTIANERLVFSIIGRAPNHACGIEAQTGFAYCWGDTHAGALGVGDLTNDGSIYDVPALVSGARRFSSISVSSYDTCGIEAITGFAYCWGYNNNGQLGNGTSAIGWVPTLVGSSIRFSRISAGVVVTCGIEAQTSVGYCWGKGGLIGDGTLAQRSVPTVVGRGLVRFSSISASETHVCGIEAGTGFLYCWGSNAGELGDGTTTERLLPTLVGSGRRFSSIDTEYHLTCGIETGTGRGYCWGKNSFGQVGDGTTTDRLVPTLVGNGTLGFSSIDAGGEVACAVEAQTNVGYCWGLNNLGQLGEGTTTDRPLPTMVGGGTPRFSSISATSWYQCGVEALTGLGYCWGGGFECPDACSIIAHSIPTLLPPPRSRGAVLSPGQSSLAGTGQ